MPKSDNCTNTETPLTVPLACLSKSDLELAGGKGANLGELVRAGLPVPDGFVVTTVSYEQFVTRNGLQAVIDRMLRSQPVNGAPIRAAFEAARIPEETEKEVLAAYQRIGQGPVAVRSSATAEDLPEAAFAGQQDSYLNISGAEALLMAVRRCWASLWTDRAIAYRDRQGVDPAAVRLAVVVQRMAAAEFAGVMFTANPVTGERDETLIDASPGLGEAVVSGLVTPDHYALHRRRWGWKITERRQGKRETIIRPLPGGGTEHVTGPANESLPELPAGAPGRLANLGQAIQRCFGSPQDIEWAWVDGKASILQARPMTALPDPPPRTTLAHRMIANNFVEMLPVRPYPLDLDTWLPALGGAVEPIFSLLGLDWRLDRLFEAEDGIVIRYNPVLPRPTWNVLLAPARLISRIVRYSPLRWKSDALLGEIKNGARDLEARDLQSLSWEKLLEILQEAKEISCLAAGEIRIRYFPRAAFSAARLRVLLVLLGYGDQFGTLLFGAGNKTLEMNQALEALAHKVRADPTLAGLFNKHRTEALESALKELPEGRDLLGELDQFLARYGHRETVISTSLRPTWKDAPAVPLGIIKNFVAYPPPSEAGQPAWQTAREKILRHGLFRFPPLRRAFLEILEEARTLIQIREDTHFYATLPLPIFRRTLLELGRRLAAAGILDSPEDVWHLRLSELEKAGGSMPPPAEFAGELRAAYLRRKNERARLGDGQLVDPRLFTAASLDENMLLRGTPGSPGAAEGPARIVRDETEFDKLVPGEVLIAPFTNPSWTPLFQRAAAVVVDSGSLASHAAIVAREYGIPAVMATMTGTQKLQDGDWVRVDGSQGVVLRAVRPSAEPSERN